jgi:hypothetical protein
MKWKANSKPNEGDVRTRRKFAWLPKQLYIDTQKYYVWLENYQIEEMYLKYDTFKRGYLEYYYCWEIVKQEPLFWEHEV